MLGHNHRADFLPQNKMRPGLAKFNKSQPFQGACRFDAVNIPWQFHASASTGSSEKCNRTRFGRSFDSK